MRARIVRDVQRLVADSLGVDAPIMLAVSGGVDSMVFLDAAAAAVSAPRLRVATFDHGSGPAATAAAALVGKRAAALGLELVAGRAPEPLRTEAALRDARWRFLRSAAEARGARVATAHTLDDQIETVLMRVLRGAGARGIAGLYAAGEVARPLLALARRDVLRYARARRLEWVEDPSNASLAFLRNRVRHELLPALLGAAPGLDRELLELARAAAAWRSDVTTYVDGAIAPRVSRAMRAADVPAARLAPFSTGELEVLWPEVAARIGLVLDRRGTDRLARFTRNARVGARVQLSGGWQVIRSRDAFQLRASEHAPLAETPLRASAGTRWDRWEFRPIPGAPAADAWSAWLPGEAPLAVRRWRPGDVMSVRTDGPPRKVKYFLSDAGITGHERQRWPVVLAGDQIVWIPGVRRSAVATARSGWPALAFACEYIDR
jgi:tRNA(Ile)-lysidine synthase